MHRRHRPPALSLSGACRECGTACREPQGWATALCCKCSHLQPRMWHSRPRLWSKAPPGAMVSSPGWLVRRSLGEVGNPGKRF